MKRYIEQKRAYLRKCSPDDEHLLIIPGEKSERVQDAPCCTYTIRSPLVSRTSRYRALLDLAAIEQILEEERPDIIESGDPYQVAWKAIFSGRALGIPVVGFYHSHFPEAYLRSAAKYFGKITSQITEEASMRYVRALYNRFEKTLIPSPALAALLKSWGLENTETIDLGVDTEVFRPEPGTTPAFRQTHSLPENRILLLYVGRLASEKNVRTLFASFRNLSCSHPAKYHLLCVGDGPLRSALQKLEEETGAATWMPYCGNAEDLASLYRSADLFVHPSVNETFGLVTLESQACGTPVVGIRGSYMDRIIFSDQAHWASENRPDSLAEAIRQMSSQDLRVIGLAVAESVRSRYSWTNVFDRLFGIYRGVCSRYTH